MGVLRGYPGCGDAVPETLVLWIAPAGAIEDPGTGPY